MQSYTLKFNFQIILYFFIENLCFCSLKIAVCAPKITIGRKKLKIHIRLKITAESKNYYLKIPVRVCMCARMYARAYECGQIAIRTHDKDQHTTGTGPPEHTTTGKERNTGKAEKPVYICLITDNEKKYKKKLKKIWKYEKRL